ncbi:MAG: hypothetical protein NDJ92_01035, partial [Thermoanaerobaculia bacterium]|nr:hypothetical protein [Thermoanaerobaculia bacterium]
SPIVRAEYAIDAKEWVRLAPVDGIGDSLVEEFQIDASSAKGKFVVVRAVDEQYNVATATVGVE